jgi:hypothetical protein
MVKALMVLALAPAFADVVSGASLRPEAVKAWEAYVSNAELRMQARASGQQPFLWADESNDRKRNVLAGEIAISPMTKTGYENTADGLIHHWVGAVFIPNSTLADLSRMFHAYECYRVYYKPFVANSKVLSSTGSQEEFMMIFQYHAFLANVAIEATYEKREFRLSGNRRYSISRTSQVREIQAYGRAGERRLPPDSGSGYVWRLETIARYEERDGGVYLELEAMALTRDIPAALRWMISPMVKRMSINSMDGTLQKTRAAVRTLQAGEKCGLCRSPLTSADLKASEGNK